MSRKKYTLEEVIELLKKRYEQAQKLGYVRNHLAWALYQVWKEVDGSGRTDRYYE